MTSEYIEILKTSYKGVKRERHRMYLKKRKKEEINLNDYHKLNCIMAELRAIINQGGKTIFI